MGNELHFADVAGKRNLLYARRYDWQVTISTEQGSKFRKLKSQHLFVRGTVRGILEISEWTTDTTATLGGRHWFFKVSTTQVFSLRNRDNFSLLLFGH